MININFSGNTIINGRVINGCGTGKTQNFDEKKSEYANNVENITIDSAVADINVSISNSSNVEAHFYGQANIDGGISFDVRKVNRDLKVTLQFTGNCYNGNLKLDVTLPQKIFKVITAKSTSADVTLNEGVSTDYIKVKTLSGDLETNATFTNASISTISGNVDLCIDAKKDVSVEITTISGDVSTEFKNIRYINISTSTISENVKNTHKSVSGHIANVDVSTMSGNIKIK